MNEDDYFKLKYVGDEEIVKQSETKKNDDDFIVIKKNIFYAPIIREHKKVAPYKGKLRRPPDEMPLATFYDYQCYKLAWDRAHRLKC